jgi:hypothetical protein
MASVECLGCGQLRSVDDDGVLGAGGCPRCGYVGWAHSVDLSEDERWMLREIPVEERGLRPALYGRDLSRPDD